MIFTYFLSTLKDIITTGARGFVRSKVIPISDLKTSAGLTLTASTDPKITTAETNAVVVDWITGSTATCLLNLTVPLDYDKDSDYLRLKLLTNSSGTNNTPTFGSTLYMKRAGSDLSADLGPTASAAIPTSAVKADDRFITVSGKGLYPKDVLWFQFKPGTHATDDVVLYGVEVQYKSTLVPFTYSDR